MWILIRWPHKKAADVDLHCFQKRINPGSDEGLRMETSTCDDVLSQFQEEHGGSVVECLT